MQCLNTVTTAEEESNTFLDFSVFKHLYVVAQTSCVAFSDQDGALSSAVGSGVPQTLQQEFSLVNLQIRNVNVEVRMKHVHTPSLKA